MANTFRNLVIGLVLSMFFIFIFYSMLTEMSATYGIVNSPDELSKINLTGINNTLGGIKETAEDWKSNFAQQTWTGLLYYIVVPGIPTLMKTILDFITVPYYLFDTMVTNIIGVPVFIRDIIYAIFIIVIIFGLWRLYKTGD